MKARTILAAIAAVALLSSNALVANVLPGGGGEKTEISAARAKTTLNAVFTDVDHNRVTVRLNPNETGAAFIRIFNRYNRLVIEEGFNKASDVFRRYDFSSLSNGTYKIEVKTEKGTSVYSYAK